MRLAAGEQSLMFTLWPVSGGLGGAAMVKEEEGNKRYCSICC